MPVAPGTTLGPYEILSPLGAGGMGEVYRARDTRLGREVALKILPEAVSQDAERLRRFQTEARSASDVNHPNLLAVFDVGEHDGTSFIVSELLQGETLREHLDGTTLSVRRATDYAVQIARGLAAAHERGIIHRDLKPENLFVTTDGRAKILDFGLAKQVERIGPEDVDVEAATRKINTGPGVVMGTVGYMSPEQAAGRVADHRSDIFSFGAVLYEMLTGRRAFRGETAIETLNAIIKEDPQEFSAAAERPIPPALESVVLHCLEKRPERRFQSAGDLAFALEAVSGHSGSTGVGVQAPAATTARAPRRERLIWIGVCALLALSSVALAVAYFSRARTTPRALRLAMPLPPKATFPERVTVSPDGRSVVFVATNPEGKRVLWVRPLEAPEAQPLSGTEGAESPFWSPDSRFVAFFANGKLNKIDTAGGRPQALCDAAEDRGGAWGRDGVILFAGHEGLYRVPAGGGAAPALATRADAKEEAHRWPYFLPDGRHFIFLGDAPRTEDHHVRLGSLDSQESRILFHAVSRIVYAPPGYLLFVRQGALVAQPFDAAALSLSGDAVNVAEHVAEVGLNHEYDFSASDDGVLAYQSGNPNSRLAWFDRAGKQLESAGEPADYAALSLSPDGRRVAFSLLDADRRYGDLWLYDLARGTNSRLTFDPQGDGDPVWSPDGGRVAFSSNRGTLHTNIYQKSAGGAGEDELLCESEAEKFPTSWSRDAQLILFDNCEPKAKCGIWVQPLAGERRPRPYLRSAAFQQASGQFSPDGKLVAYVSDESGRREVYVQPFPTPGEKWQVSTTGGALPLWRADGRELFYLSGDRLMAADVKTTGGTFESGPPRALFPLNMKRGYGGYGYAVAPDGQRFLINTPVEPPGAAPLVVVLNWTSGLTR